ncbi:MAG TPA: hypothetical protein VFR77_06045 [Steroidobacteraceae bacterium]|nr:hypothetical protein [Steroidobacteraceae bacterium]
MTGGITRFCALALACLCCTPALAARIVDPASARAAISAREIVAQDDGLAALASRGRATELAARLEVIARDASLDVVAQEWLIDRGLHALARMAPSPAARASVSRLALRAPVAFTRVDPDHGNRATPLYDAGATARFVLKSWERSAAAAAAAADLAARSSRAVARFERESSAASRDGIADAFRAAPVAELAAQRPAIVSRLRAGRRMDALAVILATRLADPELFGLVIDYADEREARAAVAAVSRALEPGEALESLARASRRGDIASAAVLEAGRLAATDPAARRFLFDSLADPGVAPSAAAALGRLADPSVSAEIGRRLAGAQSDEARRPLVLALRLDASPAARAELERFAREGGGSPKLRAKAARGLER